VHSREVDKNYPIQVRKAKHVVDGDEEIFAELLETFLEHLPEQMRPLETALEHMDDEKLRFYAHQLKGGLKNFAAEEASERAFALETAALKKEFEKARELLPLLQKEVENLKNYIKIGAWKKFF
jgi:HPt (histidine-containing phosphotransfer) domain-containing protein